jgi:hypothetical protein
MLLHPLPRHARTQRWTAALVSVVALALVVGSALAAGGPMLAAPFIGFDPSNVQLTDAALTDFNADGHLDLAVSSVESGVMIFLGNGDGTLGTPQGYATPQFCMGVVVGDFNGDGKQDFASACQGPPTTVVCVQLGNGDGTFGPRVDYPTGQYPEDLAGIDVNGDGRLDLLTVDNPTNTVSVLLGHADGTFGARTSFSTLRQPMALAAGDVTGDGKPDVVVIPFYDRHMMVHPGNGNGTFGPAIDIALPRQTSSVFIRDINSDSRPDLILANEDFLSVWLDGPGGARIDYPVGVTTYGLGAADLDRDGVVDVVVGSGYQGRVSFFRGHGDGSLALSSTSPSMATRTAAIAVGDLNEDGWPDLAIANSGWGATVYLGVGAGRFGVVDTVAMPASPRAVASADLDGDGRMDLLVANGSANTVSAMLGRGDLSFAPRIDYPMGPVPAGVVLADFDGDGRLDFAATHSGASGGAVRLGLGDGTFGPMIPFETGEGPVAIASADLDGDGHPDLVTTNDSLKTISVLLGNGDGTFRPRVDYNVPSRPRGIAIGDLDGDGRPDVVTVSAALTVRLGIGDGQLGPPVDYPTPGSSVAIVDLDRDGRPDVVVAQGPVVVRRGNGDGTLGAGTVYATKVGATNLAAVDMDADGMLDLVTDSWAGQVSVLFGRGDATFGPRLDYGVAGNVTCLTTGDFDGDGRPDVVTGVGYDVEILRNLVGRGWPALGVEGPVRAGTIELSCSPNPARGAARIRFTLPLAMDIRLTVRDVAGRRVADLASGRLAAGTHTILWNSRASRARPGVYFADLRASGRSIVKRLVVTE